MLSRQRVVVPALEQRNVLRGRVWGRLVQAEVLLKHDADQGLIQVDQVCLHTLAIACSLHRLICPRPRGAFLALTAILTPAAPSPRAKRSSATTSRTTWSEGARTCRVHCLASWRGAAASGFSRNQLGAAIGYRAADVEPRWAAGVDDALRATPWQTKVEEDGLCFRSADETKGREWMLVVMQVLFLGGCHCLCIFFKHLLCT